MGTKPHHIIIKAQISNMSKQEIAEILRKSFDTEVEFSYDESSTSQLLDVPISLAIAGVLLGIAELIISIRLDAEAKKWTLDKVKSVVREAAAGFVGTDELSDLRFKDYNEFKEGTTSTCWVTADIYDELYSFIVSRKGNVEVIKHESQ